MSASVTLPDGYHRCLCAECGEQVVLSSSFFRHVERNKLDYYCPRGHRSVLTVDSVVKERDELQRAKEYHLGRIERQEKQLAQQRGQITKLRKKLGLQ
ncbi:MAG: hypothetical protein E6R03_12300 [Hyphomicrobiaceae bacterium]|nr:MAG: hypothetical protein E6R03_12300 [Hyphomicrobiaceae bacterium]